MWVARARGGMVPCLCGSGGFAPRVRDCCRGCVRGVVTVYLLHSGFMTLRSTWEEPKPNTHPSGRGSLDRVTSGSHPCSTSRNVSAFRGAFTA